MIAGLTPSILRPWLAVAPTYPASVAGSRTDLSCVRGWQSHRRGTRGIVVGGLLRCADGCRGARGSPAAGVHARNAGGRLRRVAPAFPLTGPYRWYAP